VQQGPFAPRALPRFTATTDPAATVSSSADFPGPPVIRPTLLRRFLDGTRTASPVARHVLVTVLPLLPRQSDQPPQSDCDKPCCLRPNGEGSASGSCFLSRPPVSSLPLRPGDSLALPKRALSVGFTRFVSSTDATQATGLLTPTPVGLTPTEHASLTWTHSTPKTHAGAAGCLPESTGTRRAHRRPPPLLHRCCQRRGAWGSCRRLYTGANGESRDTARAFPTGHRASPRPYQDEGLGPLGMPRFTGYCYYGVATTRSG
jgi:hypothetical protein